MHGRRALVALNRGTVIKYLHGDDKTQKSAKKIIGKKSRMKLITRKIPLLDDKDDYRFFTL